MKRLANTDSPESETILGSELQALRRRLQPDETLDVRAYGASTIGDIAEAAGVPPETVREHLRQIRAEEAFRHSGTRPFPWIGFVGAFALVIGAATIYLRTRENVIVGMPIRPSATYNTARRDVVTETLPVRVFQLGPEAPFGARIEVSGVTKSVMGDGWSRSKRALRMPYDETREQLANGLLTLAQHVALEDHPTAPPGKKYHDFSGNVFTTERGGAHYAIESWGGTISGSFKLPLEVGEARRIADEVLRPALEKQRESTRIDGIDPTQGVVTPPPGFMVTYSGLKSDTEEGPVYSFDEAPSEVIAKRMELAIRNMLFRDSILARNSGKPPKAAIVDIFGPGGKTSFELPLKGDPTAILRAKCAEAVRLAETPEAQP